jgi:hypothetical protein
MADVCWPATIADHVLAAFLERHRPAARLDRSAAALLQFELERAGQRIGLGQPQPQPVAHCIARAALLAFENLRLLVVVEPLRAQRGDRHQTVAAQPDDRREEAELLHSGDARVEHFADARRKPGGDIAIDRLALGRHGAALGIADRLADPAQIVAVAVGQARMWQGMPDLGAGCSSPKASTSAR